jgi:hypothetical protein
MMQVICDNSNSPPLTVFDYFGEDLLFDKGLVGVEKTWDHLCRLYEYAYVFYHDAVEGNHTFAGSVDANICKTCITSFDANLHTQQLNNVVQVSKTTMRSPEAFDFWCRGPD